MAEWTSGSTVLSGSKAPPPPWEGRSHTSHLESLLSLQHLTIEQAFFIRVFSTFQMRI